MKKEAQNPFSDNRSEDEKGAYDKSQTKNRQIRQDRYKYERYKMRLGVEAPKTFSAFRRMKKAGGVAWEDMQDKYKLYNRGIDKGVIPGAINAATPEAKLKGYLLNSNHVVGMHKAHVIASVLGYGEHNWEEFSDKLYNEIQKSPFTVEKHFTFTRNGDKIKSVKYEVPIIMAGKTGRMLKLNTVWQIDEQSNIPRFITATFPKKKGEK